MSSIPLFRSYQRKTINSPSYDGSLPLSIISTEKTILGLSCFTKVANTKLDSVVQREQSSLVLMDLLNGELLSDRFVEVNSSITFSDWDKVECLCYHAIPEYNAVLVAFASGDLILYKLELSSESGKHKKLRVWKINGVCVSMDAYHHESIRNIKKNTENDVSGSDIESSNEDLNIENEAPRSTSTWNNDAKEKFNHLVALGFANGSVKILDIKSGKIIKELANGDGGRVHLVRFATERFIWVCDMHGMKIWDIEENVCTKNIIDSTVTDLRMIGDDRFVATCGSRSLTIHDLVSGNLLRSIPVFDTVMQLLVLPKFLFDEDLVERIDSEFAIVTFSEEGYIRLYDSGNNRKEEAEFTAPLDPLKPSFASVHYSAPHNMIVAGTEDADILFIDPLTLERVKQVVGFNDSVLDVAVNNFKNANELVIATTSDKILVIDRDTKDTSFLIGHNDSVTTLAVGVVGGTPIIASASRDRTVRLWDLKEKKCVALCDTHTDAVTAIAMNTDTGNFLVSVGEDTVMKKYPLKQVKDQINAWSGRDIPDESLLIMSNESRKVHEKEVNDIDISVNGKLIATASYDKKVKIWNAEDLNLVDTFTHRKGVWTARFSPTEKCVATGCADNMIRIWSLTNHTCLKVLEGHSQHVIRLVYLNKGTQIMSASNSGIMKLWNIKTGECVSSFDEHSDRIWGLRALKDGKEIITGSEDRTIISWTENTKQAATNKKRVEDEMILQEQKLRNLVNNKEYLEAVILAISLDQPRKTYGLFDEILTFQENLVPQIVKALEHNQLMRLFEYTIDWNTNARFSHVSHRILHAMFTVLDPKFVSWNYEKSVDSILAYSQKHTKRVENLIESSYMLDYILHQMKILFPEEEIKEFEKTLEPLVEKVDIVDSDEDLFMNDLELNQEEPRKRYRKPKKFQVAKKQTGPRLIQMVDGERKRKREDEPSFNKRSRSNDD